MIPVEESWIIESIAHGDWIRLLDGAPLDDIVSSDDVTHVVHATDRSIVRVRHDGPPEPLGELTFFDGEQVVIPGFGILTRCPCCGGRFTDGSVHLEDKYRSGTPANEHHACRRIECGTCGTYYLTLRAEELLRTRDPAAVKGIRPWWDPIAERSIVDSGIVETKAPG